MINQGMMTSNTSEWETPQDFFDEVNKEFDFGLDACATRENAKVTPFYSKLTDGLEHDWDWASGGKWTWMNPPYGREISKWVEKASHHKTVCLLPARTDTRWFHDHIYGKADIRFLKGRLKFGGSKNSAPFPSMIVIFNPPIKR